MLAAKQPRSSAKHGLTLSVAAAERLLRAAVDRSGRQKRLTVAAPVFLTAALEYMCAELWELCDSEPDGLISVGVIRRAIDGDPEIQAMFSLEALIRDGQSVAGYMSNAWRCELDGSETERWQSAAELVAYQAVAHPRLTASMERLDVQQQELMPHWPACWLPEGSEDSGLNQWLGLWRHNALLAQARAVLGQIDPADSVHDSALALVAGLVIRCGNTLAALASELAVDGVISHRHVVVAIQLTFPKGNGVSGLAQHAMSEGTKAITKYTARPPRAFDNSTESARPKPPPRIAESVTFAEELISACGELMEVKERLWSRIRHPGNKGLPPVYWGLSLAQLELWVGLCQRDAIKWSGLSDCTEWFKKPGVVNCYQLSDNFGKPFTSGTGCGVAPLLNPEQPLAAEVMISHTWAEDVDELLQALRDCAIDDGSHGNLCVWLCVLANFQCADGSGPSIAEQLAGDPFCQVINQARFMCLVVTSTQDPYQRLWCVWELFCALEAKSKLKVLMEFSGKARELYKNRIEQWAQEQAEASELSLGSWLEMQPNGPEYAYYTQVVRCEEAKCSVEADREMIAGKVEASCGWQLLNERVAEFRRPR